MRYLVSERGVALLKGKSVPERAKAIICLAHPKVRGWLTDEAQKLGVSVGCLSES